MNLMKASSADDENLDSLLKKSSNQTSSLLPNELAYLITAFLPTQPNDHRSKAYLVLASFCQGVRGSAPTAKADGPDPGTLSLTNVFSPLLRSRLEDNAEGEIMAVISFLVALFQVDWQSASSVLQQEGTIEIIMDSVDLPSSSAALCLQVAHLLGQASGHKIVRAIITAQSREWLEAKSRQTKDTALRAASAVALIKLSRGTATDAAEVTNMEAKVDSAKEAELVKSMKGLVVDDKSLSSIADAVEGLAYLSVDSTVKETLSKDSSFLAKLFSLVPRGKKSAQVASDLNPTLIYGIIVILSNICAYRAHLSEEQVQMAKLRQMAKVGKTSQGDETLESDPLEDNNHAKERGRRLIKAGVLEVLPAMVLLTDSRGVRVHASKAYLSLVEDQQYRGKILQMGGAKTLSLIIRKALTSELKPNAKAKVPSLEMPDLEAIQALAKLAITASPVQVFGPNEGAIHDTVRPLSLLLLHPFSTLLQRFEAIMALTNLSSQSSETASRIARVDGLLNKVELLLLEDHTLTRRAATELVCNLIVGSDDVFERYGGAGSPAKSKLQILLALSDVDDLATCLAASGALATLTSAPSACTTLYNLHCERHRVLPILTMLINPSALSPSEDEDRSEGSSNPGLVHRGVICAHNFILSIRDSTARKEVSKEADEVGLSKALLNIIQGGDLDDTVLCSASEVLEILLEYNN